MIALLTSQGTLRARPPYFYRVLTVKLIMWRLHQINIREGHSASNIYWCNLPISSKCRTICGISIHQAPKFLTFSPTRNRGGASPPDALRTLPVWLVFENKKSRRADCRIYIHVSGCRADASIKRC